MQIHQGIDQLPFIQGAVVTSGTFDGVHVGHQKILKRLSEISAEIGGESVVLTFWPHPRYVVGEANPELKLLSTIEEKIELLDKNKVDHLVIIPFTKAFSQLTSAEFIQKILIEKLNTKKLVIGYDHRFGKNREGSFEYLKEHSELFNFSIEEIPEQDVHDIAVSSTKIRNALVEGKIEVANEFLGWSYSIRGKVVEGDKIGRALGFPTANLFVEESFKLIPADGIYAAFIKLNGIIYNGIAYIGNRPTLNAHKKSIEAFIFDFNKTIYGEKLELSFVEFVRGDALFDSLEELKVQIGKDVEEAKRILQKPD